MAVKKSTKRKGKPSGDIARGRALMKREFPVRLAATPEEWRALKRTEWREVRQALSRFYHGSAYVPAGSALHQLGTLADQVSAAIEADGWIAW